MENTFYVPSFSRNLFFVPRLMCTGFSFRFCNVSLELIKDNEVVGCGVLVEKLFKLSLDSIFESSLVDLYTTIGTK